MAQATGAGTAKRLLGIVQSPVDEKYDRAE